MLEKDLKDNKAYKILEDLLKLIREEKIEEQLSTLSYLLISLSHLSRMKLAEAKSQVQFSERLPEFVSHWATKDAESTIIHI